MTTSDVHKLKHKWPTQGDRNDCTSRHVLVHASRINTKCNHCKRRYNSFGCNYDCIPGDYGSTRYWYNFTGVFSSGIWGCSSVFEFHVSGRSVRLCWIRSCSNRKSHYPWSVAQLRRQEGYFGGNLAACTMLGLIPDIYASSNFI